MRKGGPPPLPGQPGYKVSETETLEREAKDMEVRLQMLQERMQQQNLDDAAVSKGGSRWRSARPDKGSVTTYAKDVQEKIKRRASEGPPTSSAAATSSDAKGPLPPRRLSRPTQQEGDDFRSKDIDAWTVADVRDWLHAVLLGQYAPLFEGNEINGPILLEITLEDLDYMGMTILGHRKVLLRGIEDLRKNRRVTISLAAAPPSGSSVQQQHNNHQQDTRLTSQSLEVRAGALPRSHPLHFLTFQSPPSPPPPSSPKPAEPARPAAPPSPRAAPVLALVAARAPGVQQGQLSGRCPGECGRRRHAGRGGRAGGLRRGSHGLAKGGRQGAD